ECFIVKEMNEFTTSISPLIFPHSNFASFVRQLNKFHKVCLLLRTVLFGLSSRCLSQMKNTDENVVGEHASPLPRRSLRTSDLVIIVGFSAISTFTPIVATHSNTSNAMSSATCAC
ncbi:hypothetical protein BC835DRAFT_1279478, partial [Cytidiella melzeri]